MSPMSHISHFKTGLLLDAGSPEVPGNIKQAQSSPNGALL
jgi:hypothetical protein